MIAKSVGMGGVGGGEFVGRKGVRSEGVAIQNLQSNNRS